MATYSSIFSCVSDRESDGDNNSMTKSGHSGRNRSFCSAVSVLNRVRLTHATSGDRVAPLGSSKPVDESNVTPVPSARAHAATCSNRFEFRAPVNPPAGGMTMMSPPALRSRRRSRFSVHSRKNCSGVSSTPRPACKTKGPRSNAAGSRSLSE